ncbi:MAG: cytochrome c biogenesis protein CcsA [Moraxellaceae bacterium]|nr:cytochrome c biogenesis protein CcsA [Moraxellaceae bacterium]
MNATLAGIAAALLYAVASAMLGRQLLRREKPRAPAIQALGGLALPLHLISIHAQIYQPAGLDLGLFQISSLVGWLIAALAIGMSLYKPIISITVAAFPLAILGLILSLFAPSTYTPVSTLSPGAESHILLSILAYSVLTIAAAQALLVAIQDRHLRTHKQGLMNALPPLQTMESLLFSLIGTGFVLLTLAIVTGFLTLNDLFAQHVAHKTVLTLAAWAVFAVLLAGRHWLGWRGPTAIRFTLWGFALLLLGFYGSKLVLELVLSRSA